MKIKSLVIIGNYFTSNMNVYLNKEYRTHKICEAFRMSGVSCKVILINYKSLFSTKSFDENEVIVLNLLDIFNFRKRKLLNQVLNKSTHVWYTNGPLVGFLSRLFVRAKSNSIIYEVLDNYRTYFPSIYPLLSLFERNIKRKAEKIAYVTKELANLDVDFEQKNTIFFNGIDSRIFYPMNKESCKRKYSLRVDKKTIGFTGSIDKRVKDNLITIVNSPKLKNFEFHIVTNSEIDFSIPSNCTVSRKVPLNQMASAINSCDLVIIPNRKDEFTRYCFPSKTAEIIACKVDFLITPINSLNGVINESNIATFDVENFVELIIEKLATKYYFSPYNVDSFTWTHLVEKSFFKD